MKVVNALTAIVGTMVAVTLTFYCLKLLQVAPVEAWPWWAVYSPLWAPLALVALAAVVLLLGLAGERGLQRMERWAREA